jgi:MinD-like ATPase involved in chromosome partitioning or flagellar assembly/tetratricopeptide (TPR) repeat protein
MEIITFFSFKGGVGRTQALLNTACEFAQRGKKVLLMDFDLHAPGLSLMECMHPSEKDQKQERPGTLDFFEWLVFLNEAVRRGEPKPDPINLAACAYAPAISDRLRDGAGSFKFIPASPLARKCADAADYSDRVHAVDSPLTDVIRRTHRNREKNPVVEQIRSQFASLPEDERPDAIFIDARTGITGIADLLLTRSSDRIVLVTGLNEQNLWGLESTLQDIERSVETADWLRRITIVISPVPLGEHELTEKRIRAIVNTLSRHVDRTEREMFGDTGLIPSPVEIPYDAQLALLEDPILLRHEKSVPAERYRQLADRLGGKIEPLQFRQVEADERARPSNDGLPPEHPLTRVLPWDAGLASKDAEAIFASFIGKGGLNKPHSEWPRHALNFMANSLALARMDDKGRNEVLHRLPSLTVSHRDALMTTFREERQQQFAIPKSDWLGLAAAVGQARAKWLLAIKPSKEDASLRWKSLVAETASAAAWGPYWTELADSLRMGGFREEAIAILSEGTRKFSGRPDFGVTAVQVLVMANSYQEALSTADTLIDFARAHNNLGLVSAYVQKARVLAALARLDEAISMLERAEVLARTQNDSRGLANTLISQGDLLARTAKLEEARARFDEALPIYREVKDRLGEANTLRSLGDVLVRAGELEEAKTRYDEALPIYREVKERLGEANTLQGLANWYLAKEDMPRCQEMVDDCIKRYEALSDAEGKWETYLILARLRAAQGRDAEALAIARTVAEEAHANGYLLLERLALELQKT